MKEREALMLTVLPFAVVEVSGGHFLEVVSADEEKALLRLHGTGKALLRITRCGRFEELETVCDGISCEVELHK